MILTSLTSSQDDLIHLDQLVRCRLRLADRMEPDSVGGESSMRVRLKVETAQ